MEMERSKQIRKMFAKKNLKDMVIDWIFVGKGEGEINKLF